MCTSFSIDKIKFVGVDIHGDPKKTTYINGSMSTSTPTINYIFMYVGVGASLVFAQEEYIIKKRVLVKKLK